MGSSEVERSSPKYICDYYNIEECLTKNTLTIIYLQLA